MRRIIAMGLASATLAAGSAQAADHLVTQKNNAFTVRDLKAKVGDEISFRNDDAVFHNVFSLSATQSFDLGAYGQGLSKKVKLEKAGKIEVECAIHPSMKMVVDVSN